MLDGQYSSKYEEIQLLGRNPQDDSEMFLVKDLLGQQYRMAKKINLSDNNLGDESQLLNEATLLKQLNHPHILHYYDILLQDQVLISLLQFCEGTLVVSQRAISIATFKKRKARKKVLVKNYY